MLETSDCNISSYFSEAVIHPMDEMAPYPSRVDGRKAEEVKGTSVDHGEV